jgi:hypothetical protein
MKLLITLALITFNVNAMELQAYKSTTSKVVKIVDSEVDKIFSASFKNPACLKDGSKIIGVNSAFKKNGLGYRDCSSSDAAKAKQSALGFEVVVVKLEQLSPAKMRKALGLN